MDQAHANPEKMFRRFLSATTHVRGGPRIYPDQTFVTRLKSHRRTWTLWPPMGALEIALRAETPDALLPKRALVA